MLKLAHDPSQTARPSLDVESDSDADTPSDDDFFDQWLTGGPADAKLGSAEAAGSVSTSSPPDDTLSGSSWDWPSTPR
jgi:hypothetical protein